MTIERGATWGAVATLGADAPVCVDDAAVRRLVSTAVNQPGEQRTGIERPVLALAGGDLCRTLGGKGDVATRLGSATPLLPCDAGVATCGDERHLFVAHCLLVPVRGGPEPGWRWLRGQLIAAMNAAWLREWNVAPRAHPGDGRLDVVEVSAAMAPRQRIEARRRVPHGGHVPHPAISVRRARAATPHEVHLDKPMRLVIDGESIDVVDRVSFDLIPDAFVAAV